MHSVVKLVLVALVAVVCVDALAAASTSAAEPLFITGTGKALLFTGTSGVVTLRSKTGTGTEGTITCEKTLTFHGLALNESALVRELHIEFKGKCEQTVGSNKGTCSEPIKLASSYGELGLLHGHVLILVAPESGTLFVEVKCTNGNTDVRGAIIGEFTLNGRGGSSQYNGALEDFLLSFNAKGITQEPESIELSGTLMTGVGLSTEGLFSGKASEEATELLSFDGLAQINGPQPPAQNLIVKPFKSDSEANNCPQVPATEIVEFETLNTSWCEYKVENNTRPAGVMLIGVAIDLPPPIECFQVSCLVEEAPEGGRNQCKTGTTATILASPNGVCYIRLKYTKMIEAQERVVFQVVAMELAGMHPLSTLRSYQQVA
jgi:hypothetical protein